jgi:glutamate racemase
VLGCTHFGWLKQEIGSVFKNATLVLGDRMIARELQKNSFGRKRSSSHRNPNDGFG